jgi:formamidopyrimidine-DNA glycosylase
MPELPEVETVVRSLRPKLEGRTIIKVNILDKRIIKFNEVDDFTKRVEGKKISQLTRAGKFMLLDLVSDSPEAEVENLIIHLAMVGKFLYTVDGDYSIFGDNVANHILVELFLDDGNRMISSDYRRLGSLRVVTDNELNYADYRYQPYKHLKTMRELGPDPFTDEDAEDGFLNNIRKKKYWYKPIKDVLLDQTVTAGIGNIYASECLFPAATHPETMVHLLSDDKLREIFRHAKELMLLSLSMGGSSIRDYTDGDGNEGSFQKVLKLYDQTECKVCGGGIIKNFIEKRATYHCPTCQPE